MDIGQKALLVTMMNSQGFLLATRLGEGLLKEMETLALECDDDTKVAGLVKEARAARTFWNRFINHLDNAKNPTETEFVEVSY